MIIDDSSLAANKVAREFEFEALHTLVSKFSDIPENRSKSARMRGICDHEWTRRAAAASLIGELLQNLSALDLSGSTNVRQEFALRDLNLASSCCYQAGPRSSCQRAMCSMWVGR